MTEVRLATATEADELHALASGSYDPSWQWCADAPPYPSRAEFDEYLASPEHEVIVVTVDGALRLYRVNGRDGLPVALGYWRQPGLPPQPGVNPDHVEWAAWALALSRKLHPGETCQLVHDGTNPKVLPLHVTIGERADELLAQGAV